MVSSQDIVTTVLLLGYTGSISRTEDYRVLSQDFQRDGKLIYFVRGFVKYIPASEAQAFVPERRVARNTPR